MKGQKRPRESEHPANHVPIEQPPKRLRPSIPGSSCRQALDREALSGLSTSQQDHHISYWAYQGHSWPKEYFQDSMQRLIQKKQSSASLRRKRSDKSLAASTTSSDQKPRDEKSAPYRNPSYRTLLQNQGGLYMDKSEHGITDASKGLCRKLLQKKYATPPGNTIFQDTLFDNACRKLQDKNEARIIQDIARLLVPSAETLATLGDKRLAILVESVNEGWNNCIPVTNPRPQPDYAAAFGRSAFSDDQLSKLGHSLSDPTYLSCFMATYYMHFPFLTCEVKSGTTGLDIADRQNGHSMAVAVRGIVELFKLGKRESELHRELLTFSISHDHRTVRLYGYYPILDGRKINIYRHPIHTFDITALDGKEKWTTYNFTMGIYIYSLTLIEKIRSVIDELPPDFNLEDSQKSEPQSSEPQPSEHSGLSQQFETQPLAQEPGEQDSESRHGDLRPLTPDTSMETISKRKRRP